MKILITGVYGIVGSYLCEMLKKEHEIIGIGRKDSYDKCHKYYKCDITNKSEMEKIFKENEDLDFIIHSAALAHNKGNDLSKDRFMQVNYEATKYIVSLASEMLKLKNFIFISTISVYGEKLEQSEYKEENECFPKSPYAIAKLMSENYIKNNYLENYTILRLAPVYSDTFKLNIERRTKAKGIKYRVGNGKNRLSLCNTDNIYIAIKHIVENYKEEISEIYNISDKKVWDFNEISNMLETGGKRIVIPKFLIKMLYSTNKAIIKNNFINENSIKLISDNIYRSDKINNKIKSRR